ncbi:unnamed protein product [Spirodela intermedia]|uniref:Uncharacterized protein n=2 Tax=Spirodela intermedia TaxID=51605 RepID=A0A7I8IKC8_SPIIN|nr:unnamed protein product [Spirodela intermedia]CAA6658350.1 unnamed protein product [Spirodela intermedia]CAA7394578.1 unnamed protein product [Spirodela intermedia]
MAGVCVAFLVAAQVVVARASGRLLAAVPAPAPAGVDEKRRRWFHVSLAAAQLMLGGLAATVFAVVFCYIRVTRGRSRQDSQESKS